MEISRLNNAGARLRPSGSAEISRLNNAGGRLATAAPLALWAALVAVAWAWGDAINEAGSQMAVNTPPIYGEWDVRLTPAVVAPIVVAALVVAFGPRPALAVRWRGFLLVAFAVALAWPIALALVTGAHGLFNPLDRPPEYLVDVPSVGSPGEFLAGFTDRLDEYTTHVRSHPPGFLLIAWGLAEIGLPGREPISLLVVAAAASAAPAALVAARAVAGEEHARRAAPFLVLAPGAVWIATSADALFMAVGAWAVALSVLAVCSSGRRAVLLGLAGGVLFGICLFLSYGLALLGVIPLTVAALRRRLGRLPWIAAGAAAVVLAFAAAGFWWLDGFLATREQYLASVAQHRAYDYFLMANLASFALIAGPALAVALSRARLTAAWALPLAALAALALADVSGMSKAEVERIWLPFLPWALLGTGALPAGRASRALLAAGACLGVAIQVGVRTPW